MKNIIMGIMGCMIAVYTIVSCLGIYSISARKNEMENSISQVLEQNLNRYYMSGTSDAQVQELVKQDLVRQMYAASELTVDIRSCDMTAGIISVCVTEKFGLPGGYQKTISCEKTIIVETEEMIEVETEAETEELWF